MRNRFLFGVLCGRHSRHCCIDVLLQNDCRSPSDSRETNNCAAGFHSLVNMRRPGSVT